MATLTKKQKDQRKIDAIATLKSLGIKEGDTIYTTTNYVGNMGTAYVRVFFVNDDKRIVNITYYAGHAGGQSVRDRDGQWNIHTGGGGYSRGFHVVDSLSWALFGGSYLLKETEM